MGSGIAGLACAYGLQHRHDVTLIEADARLGGHAHTVDVELDGRRFPVDTGFMVFNRATYPRFGGLLAELGIDWVDTEMSFGVAHEGRGVEWASHGARSFFVRPRAWLDADLWRMLGDLRRFFRDARALADTPDEKASLQDWVVGRGYSEAFLELYLRPMSTAIWSAAPDDIFAFPAATLARFFDNHQLLSFAGREPWRVPATTGRG